MTISNTGDQPVSWWNQDIGTSFERFGIGLLEPLTERTENSNGENMRVWVLHLGHMMPSWQRMEQVLYISLNHAITQSVEKENVILDRRWLKTTTTTTNASITITATRGRPFKQLNKKRHGWRSPSLSLCKCQYTGTSIFHCHSAHSNRSKEPECLGRRDNCI